MGETRSGGARGGGKKAKSRAKSKAPSAAVETQTAAPQLTAAAAFGGAKKGKKTAAKAATVQPQLKPQRQPPVVIPAAKEEASPSPGKAKKKRVRKHKTGRTKAAAGEKNEKSEEAEEVHGDVVKTPQTKKLNATKAEASIVAESPVADVPMTRSAKKRLRKMARAGSMTREAEHGQEEEESVSRQVVLGPELPKAGRVTRASLAAAAAAATSAPSATPSESIPEQEKKSKKRKKSKRARAASHDESSANQETVVAEEEQPSEPKRKRARVVNTTHEPAPEPTVVSAGPAQPIRRIISLAKVKASTPPPSASDELTPDKKKARKTKQTAAGIDTLGNSESKVSENVEKERTLGSTTSTTMISTSMRKERVEHPEDSAIGAEDKVYVDALESARVDTSEDVIYAKESVQEGQQDSMDADEEQKDGEEDELNIDEEQKDGDEGGTSIDEEQVVEELTKELDESEGDTEEDEPEIESERHLNDDTTHEECFAGSIRDETKSDSDYTHHAEDNREDGIDDHQSVHEASEGIGEADLMYGEEGANDLSINEAMNDIDSDATDSDNEGVICNPAESGGFVLSPEVASLEPSEASADEMSTVILLSSDTESDNDDENTQEDGEMHHNEEETDQEDSGQPDAGEHGGDLAEDMYWADERHDGAESTDDEVAQVAHGDRRSYWGELSSVESVVDSDSVRWSQYDDAPQSSDEEVVADNEPESSMNQSTHTTEDNDRGSIDSDGDEPTLGATEATEALPLHDTNSTEDKTEPSGECTPAASSGKNAASDVAEVQRVLFKGRDERQDEPTPSGASSAQAQEDKSKAEDKQGSPVIQMQHSFETPRKSQPRGLPPIASHTYTTTPSKQLLESVLATSPTATVASITEGLVTPPVPPKKRSFDHAWGPSFGVDESSSIEDAVKDEVAASQSEASPLSSWFFSRGPANFKKRVVIPRSKEPSTTKALFQSTSPASPRQIVTSPRPLKKARLDIEIDSSEDTQPSGFERFVQGIMEKSSWRSWYRKDEPDQLLDPPLPAAMLRRFGGEAAVTLFAEDSLALSQSVISLQPSECVEEEAETGAEASAKKKKLSALTRLEAAIRAEKTRAKAFDQELLGLLQGNTLSGKPLSDEYASLLPTSANN